MGLVEMGAGQKVEVAREGEGQGEAETEGEGEGAAAVAVAAAADHRTLVTCFFLLRLVSSITTVLESWIGEEKGLGSALGLG